MTSRAATQLGTTCIFAVAMLLAAKVEAEPVSKGDSKRLERGGQGGIFATSKPTSTSSGRQVRSAAFGEPFEGRTSSTALSAPTTKVKTEVGLVVAITPKKKILPPSQLDITVLYAKADAMGLRLTPKSWQKDADPLFVWDAPSGGLNIAGYSYALDTAPDDTVDTTGTSWNVAADPIKRLADGPHTFWVKALNTAGTSGKPISFEIWVDTTPPTINTYTPRPGLLLNTLTPTISAQVTESHSGIDPAADVTLTVNGSSTTVTFDPLTSLLSASASGVREGSNRVELRVSDRVGNATAPLIWSFTADVTPPKGSVVINGGALMTTSVYVALNLTASDATTSIARMLVSNDPLIGYVEEPYVSLRELWRLNAVRGPQKVYVKFVDAAGNVSSPVSDEIELGLLAPDTLILSGPVGLTPGRSAKFTFSCPEGGCVFSYAFDHQPWSQWTTATSATQPELVFGNHYFKVKAAKEVNGLEGIQPDEEDPTPAERTWVVGVEAPPLFIPRGAPIKVWRVE